MDNTPTPITLWPWAEAPAEWRALSRHGGDEDWVLHIPTRFINGWYTETDIVGEDEHIPDFTPYALERVCRAIGVCDTTYHQLEDGSAIAIGAHS